MNPLEYLKTIYNEDEFDHINITLMRIAELIDDYNRVVLPQANVIKLVCDKCGYNGKMMDFNKIGIHKCINCGNEQTVL